MKMLVENVALYRQGPTIVKLPWTLAWLCGLSLLIGCDPGKKAADTKPKEPTPVATTNVPLRVWFVAGADDKPLIERQWQASDDRTVELTMFSAEDLLKQPKPLCDVLVYPANLLGELVARDWLTELPSKLQEPAKNSEGDANAAPRPAGWLEQARTNRKAWGVSLSVQAPVIMANFELPKAREVGPDDTATADEATDYWQSVISAAKAAQAKANIGGYSLPFSPDPQAICDRYLTILFSISPNENKVGTLFHPDDLRPRLTDENFIKAAKIMQELNAANTGPAGMLHSHADAWQTLCSDTPAITIGFPPLPSADVDKVNSIAVSPPPANPSRSGARPVVGYNSGRGLVVSISKQCRQTGPSIDFARWLSSEATRPVLAKRIQGISALSSYAPGSSAWQAEQVVERLGQSARLPSEPRLPLSLAYRQALGEQLVEALRGSKSIEAALADTQKAWQEITSKADPKTQVPAYLHSLGL